MCTGSATRGCQGVYSKQWELGSVCGGQGCDRVLGGVVPMRGCRAGGVMLQLWVDLCGLTQQQSRVEPSLTCSCAGFLVTATT
jgi:hypothetical protein